jgi:type I restriction enzyme S subunit
MSTDALVSPLTCPSTWSLVRLKDISTKIGSGATPTGGQAAYQETRTNYALIRSQNVFDRAFSDAGLAFISDEQADGLRNVSLQENDLLLNITGDGITFGRACIVPKSILPACVNQHVSIIRMNPSLASAGYVLSYLTHPVVKEYIEAFNAGGSRRAITKGHIESFIVPIPPRPIQDAIATLLGALDDRIALLRETNATLEAIAQALFKSWFVDFDPVRAKQQGLVPEGMDEATAALFPDGFEESSQEAIPKGWRQTTLTDLVASNEGFVQTGPFGSQLHASDYVKKGIPVVMPKDIQDRSVVADSIARVPEFDAERLSRHRLKVGDIVFSRRGDVERHALIGPREAGWLCGTGCLLVRPGGRFPSPTFLSMTLDASRARTWLVQHAVGATMPNLNTGILGSVPVLSAPVPILIAFEDVISVLEAHRGDNAATAQTLTSLRDTLLPRLISGQLRLPEAEAILEDANP